MGVSMRGLRGLGRRRFENEVLLRVGIDKM